MIRGGKVVETLDVGDKVWVNVHDPDRPRAQCAIYVERTPESRSISPGDYFWWQKDVAYWTPKQAPFRDKPISRIGSGAVPRPILP